MSNAHEDDEVTRLEKINRELSKKIGDLEDEVRRKNKALEGFIAENEALKQELGGRKPARAPAPRETAAAMIERWRAQAQKR